MIAEWGGLRGAWGGVHCKLLMLVRSRHRQLLMMGAFSVDASCPMPCALCVLCRAVSSRLPQVCSETYGLAPEVVVSGDMSARLPYLTSHLDYMVYELLKNSMRAGGRGGGRQ